MRVQNNHTKPKDILITHWGLAAVLKNYLKYHHSVWKSPQNVSFDIIVFCQLNPNSPEISNAKVVKFDLVRSEYEGDLRLRDAGFATSSMTKETSWQTHEL